MFRCVLAEEEAEGEEEEVAVEVGLFEVVEEEEVLEEDEEEANQITTRLQVLAGQGICIVFGRLVTRPSDN
jgi:hypothetical protein